MTPVLDVMQTMPTFVYLIPVVLFFGIGTSGAVAATIIYALPPVIRITGHGIRTVSTTTIEASDSLGQTGWQRLRHVQLPMARKTIIVGINQTTMAALSMVVLAAFVNGPGLGEPVLESLRILDIGRGFVPSLAIVVMAIMLDRSTTAASQRAERIARSGGEDVRRRRIVLAGTGLLAIGAVFYSRYSLWAAEFPETEIGSTIADWTNTVVRGFTDNYSTLTSSIKDGITAAFINPLEALIAESPWYLMAAVILLVAFILGGLAGAARSWPAAWPGCYFLDLWNDSMVTLTMVLVATAIVMVLALVIGVWMARSARADLVIRPVLDAAQTIPPFVYLLPALALFGPGPLRGHHRRGRLLRPGGDQAGHRRHPRGAGDDPGGGAVHRHVPLAGDPQGADPDGARLARAGGQPGPALRAVDGRHRRPRRRRRPRVRRGAGRLPQRGVGQGHGRGHLDRAPRASCSTASCAGRPG